MPFPVAGFVRRVRRIKVLSQRELADAVGVAPSTIGKLEAGSAQPGALLLRRILAIAGHRLTVIDTGGRRVEPMADWDDTRDGAGRRYPSHLDTILDPEPGEWWGDVYGLARPPETFHRDREWRDVRRRRSQWEVRVEQFRHVPPPILPEVWWRRRYQVGEYGRAAAAMTEYESWVEAGRPAPGAPPAVCRGPSRRR
ncbi:helix-turn-helix domain-containing protein [Actinoplanes sp. NPDC051633]|uniref:helix-turn-helix domain-containing protein n=1 Tax=Actinoplanes sp. NPDC051633 TaxID=3155670 RepID=UPI003439BA49